MCISQGILYRLSDFPNHFFAKARTINLAIHSHNLALKNYEQKLMPAVFQVAFTYIL